MRVALQHRQGSAISSSIKDYADSKDELLRLYRKTGNETLTSDITQLQSVVQEYVNLLEFRQENLTRVSDLRNDYSSMLDAIKSYYPSAYHFIAENVRIVACQ